LTAPGRGAFAMITSTRSLRGERATASAEDFIDCWGNNIRLIRTDGPLKPAFGLSGKQHFWQKRYYDFNTRNHPQLVEKFRYIHRNPVKAGLCERPEDWESSSFRHAGRVEIESEFIARKRERAAGRLCPAMELPHSSQNRA